MDKHVLSRTYLLRGLALGEVDEVSILSQVVEFEPGQTIMGVSDETKDIMVVIEGRVRVESKDGELIDELRSGDMVGEISFLDGKPRTANVVSGGKAKIMVIPAAGLKDLMRKNPRLESTIYKNAALALCERLREANQQVEAMSVSR